MTQKSYSSSQIENYNFFWIDSFPKGYWKIDYAFSFSDKYNSEFIVYPQTPRYT